MSHHPSHLSPQARHPNGHSPASAGQRAEVRSASDADIAKLAYEKYEARGHVDGFDREDWTAARRELLGERFGHLSHSG
jgi:hypothetical protein